METGITIRRHHDLEAGPFRPGRGIRVASGKGMLKKQHKQGRKERKTGRQPGRAMPGQSNNRVDEVGHSGVYPQSGPHPDTPDAPLRDQGSWGEGQGQPRSLVRDEGVGRSLDSSEGIERDLDEGRQGGRGRAPRAQEQRADPDELYDENTEIKRETEFRDATAHPLDPDSGGRKVTREGDVFHKEKK